MKRRLPWKKVVPALVMSLLIVCLSGFLAGCENGTSNNTTVVKSPTPTKSTSINPTPTIQPTPQPIPTNGIAVDAGWKEVLHLGNENGNLSQGTFVSTHQYQIIIICEGAGSWKLDYVPQGFATFTCQVTSQMQNIGVYHPQKVEQVTVSVTPPQDNVLWAASVQVHQ